MGMSVQTAQFLTVDEVRQHVETALEDAAIQRLLDAVESDIQRSCGGLFLEDSVVQPVTQWFVNAAHSSAIRLKQPVESVTTVEEHYTSGDPLELVADTDYWVDGNTVRTLGRVFGDRVAITYVPFDDRARRRAIMIQLVKLEINVDPGTGFEGAGSWQHTSQDYEQQRQHLLWTLCPPPTLA